MAEDNDEQEHNGGDEPFDDDTYGEFLKAQRKTFGHQLPDALLAAFAGMATRATGPIFDLTVYLGGTIIDGRLAGESEYFRLLGDDIEARADGEGAGTMAAVLRSYANTRDAEELMAGDEPTPSHYIHLVDARVWTSSPAPFARKAKLRLRLISIDGWNFGRRHPDDD